MPSLLGYYDLPDDVVQVVTKLKDRGFEDIETYSPAPFLEIDDAIDPRPSKVRIFTLVGGLLGVVTGFAMQIWMSLDWPVRIAGKPFASIPPYWIIGFELMVLFAGIFTMIGLFLLGGLYPRPVDAAYSQRFSAEEFGVCVTCDERDVGEVDRLLRAAAKEVTRVEE